MTNTIQRLRAYAEIKNCALVIIPFSDKAYAKRCLERMGYKGYVINSEELKEVKQITKKKAKKKSKIGKLRKKRNGTREVDKK